MIYKKIATALSLSPQQFLKVLREKLVHGVARIVGASYVNSYYEKKNLAKMIAHPEWAQVASVHYQVFNPLWSRKELEEIASHVSNAEIDATIAYAEHICCHEYDLLGSGFVSLGDDIDWQRDFVSGRVWPYVLAKDSFIIDLEDDSDIKIPWELSRHQYFVSLGQAYLYSGDEKYALEFKKQVVHWIEHNAYKVGVNWICSMDIGLRAISWVWARSFFEQSTLIEEDFWTLFHKVLASHGDFVYNNIEDWGGIKNNHYLSNGTALYILGLALPDLPNASKWKQKGRDMLEECCEKQILSDGVDYEMSTSYHRLVFEFLLTPYLFAKKHGEDFSAGYQKKLKKMLDFVAAYTKPDGSIALFGDGDNGRCQILSEYCRAHIRDHRYLLCIGAVLFNEGALKADARQFFDEALWLCGPQAKQQFLALEEQQNIGSRSFEEGGFYLIERGDIWCLIDCGPRGIPGAVGVHGHNDATSFELSIKGESVIVDSGMYSYSGNPQVSYNMKSSLGHNLLIIDNEEISSTPFDLWVIGDEAKPILFSVDLHRDISKIVMGHTGYERLERPVGITRSILAGDDYISIRDEAKCNDGEARKVEIRLHTALKPRIDGGDVVLEGVASNYRVTSPDSQFTPYFEVAPLAESYGQYRDCGYVFGWHSQEVVLPWSGTYEFKAEVK